MPKPELTRLTITWSRRIDSALRSHLRVQDPKKGALSRFVEDAVKWRLFDYTVSQVRDAFADVRADDLSEIVNEAVASVRKCKKSFPEK